MKKFLELISGEGKYKNIFLKAVSLLLIALITLIFMNVMLTDRDGRNSVVSKGEGMLASDSGKTDDEIRLENILSCISGIGDVEVMIRSVPNESTSVFAAENDKKNERTEGVIVVAEGAENAVTRSEIVDAVASVCCIDAADVTVFEMKQ